MATSQALRAIQSHTSSSQIRPYHIFSGAAASFRSRAQLSKSPSAQRGETDSSGNERIRKGKRLGMFTPLPREDAVTPSRAPVVARSRKPATSLQPSSKPILPDKELRAARQWAKDLAVRGGKMPVIPPEDHDKLLAFAREAPQLWTPAQLAKRFDLARVVVLLWLGADRDKTEKQRKAASEKRFATWRAMASDPRVRVGEAYALIKDLKSRRKLGLDLIVSNHSGPPRLEHQRREMEERRERQDRR